MPDPVDKGTRPLNTNQPPFRRIRTRQGRWLIAGISLVLLALSGLGVWLLFPAIGEISTSAYQPPESLAELATQYPDLGPLLTDPELDSAYKDFLLAYEKGGTEASVDLARRFGLIDQSGYLRITLVLDTSDSAALVRDLEARSIKVTGVIDNLIDVALSLERLEQILESGEASSLFLEITNLEHVIHIRLPRKGIHQVSNVGTESLAVIFADEWQAQGFTGKGIKIGVLDLGFDKYKKLLGTELPDKVTARSFIADTAIDQTGEVHGTAVAEVIHDVAPDAELFFAAYSTDVEQKLAVDWLISQGVKIISHSVRSIYGPMDGSGAEARLVDRVVAGGVLWVNCAGNDAETHYLGTFKDENGDGYHEFANGDQLMGFTPMGRVRMALNWDAWDTGDQDYDLFIMDRNMNKIVGSENIQNGPGDDAAEFIEYEFLDSGPYYIAFYARKITRPGVLNFFIYDGENLEYTTPEYSITSPADSKSSFTVGATYWLNDALESYSSQGPTLDGRLKPDISAPTGIESAAYGEPFYGTSASTPHVAGAAALVWQAYPDFTVHQVIDYLRGQAIDLGLPGADDQYGAGRLWLGDVPRKITGPAPTVEFTQTQAPFPTVTETLRVGNTVAPTATAVILVDNTVTPSATVTFTPTSTSAAIPLTSASNSLSLTLSFLVCVALPGLAGLSGVCLLGLLWYQSRNYSFNQAGPERDSGQRNEYLPEDQGTLRCPQCGTANRLGARYCRYCGIKLGGLR
jgi:subtilisin family serine protease